MNKSRAIWVVLDGKPGHENQSLALAEAIERVEGSTIHLISLLGARGMLGRIRRALSQASTLPAPRFVVGAGHATHIPLLLLAKRHRVPSIVLMKPSLPTAWFSMAFIPEHDRVEAGTGDAVVETRGVLTRVRPGMGAREGRLVLLGGPSKTHGWDVGGLLAMLGRILTGDGWAVADSRRTPEGFLGEVAKRFPGVAVHSHRDTPSEWVSGSLSRVEEVWVTEDSVSMVYEALSGGARVGLLPVVRRSVGARVTRGVDRLLADGYVTSFERWQAGGGLLDAPGILCEADRCAELVLTRFP